MSIFYTANKPGDVGGKSVSAQAGAIWRENILHRRWVTMKTTAVNQLLACNRIKDPKEKNRLKTELVFQLRKLMADHCGSIKFCCCELSSSPPKEDLINQSLMVFLSKLNSATSGHKQKVDALCGESYYKLTTRLGEKWFSEIRSAFTPQGTDDPREVRVQLQIGTCLNPASPIPTQLPKPKRKSAPKQQRSGKPKTKIPRLTVEGEPAT